MFTSILNFTSSFPQQGPEKSRVTDWSSNPQLVLNGGSNGFSSEVFSQQLTHFRQLMQVPVENNGNSLPLNEGAEQAVLPQLESTLISLLQFIERYKSTGALAEGQLTDQHGLSNLEAEQSMQDSLNAISENINALDQVMLDENSDLTDFQVEKLTNALAFLQTEVDKLNQVYFGAGVKPLEPANFHKAVDSLLDKSLLALKRVNKALKAHAGGQGSMTTSSSKIHSANMSLPLPVSTEFTGQPAEKSSDVDLNNLNLASLPKERLVKELHAQRPVKSAVELSSLNQSQLNAMTEFDLENTPLNNNLVERNLSKSIEGQLLQASKTPNQAVANLLQLVERKLAVTGSSANTAEINETSRLLSPIDSSSAVNKIASAELSGLLPSTSPQVSASSNIQQGLALRGDFSPNLALRIQWIFQQALSSAEIMMDPPELGPLSVKMQHRGGETNIIFQVNNPQTKEMIEEHLPKLKELLQEQGIALGDTHVKQNQQNQDDTETALANGAQLEEGSEPDSLSADEKSTTSMQVQLLDAYV